MNGRRRAATVWKLLGLAGVVGVAATGAVAVRNERKRRAYTPDEVRSVLHERYARATADRDGLPEVPLVPTRSGVRGRVGRLRARIRRRFPGARRGRSAERGGETVGESPNLVVGHDERR